MIIIAGKPSKSSSKEKVTKQSKRTTPSIYQKQKKKVKGFVDRISAGIIRFSNSFIETSAETL